MPTLFWNEIRQRAIALVETTKTEPLEKLVWVT